MSDDLFIIATPELRRATPGVVIKYALASKTGTLPKIINTFWFGRNDPKTLGVFQFEHFGGPNGKLEWNDASWPKPGHHEITCVVNVGGNFTRVIYEQWVVPTTDFLVNGPTLPRFKEDPAAVFDQTARIVDVAIAAAAKFPPQNDDQKDAFEDDVSQLENGRDMLKQRLESTKNFIRHPFTAEHFDAQTQTRTALRVFVSEVAFKKWLIVDWTNPAVRAMTGEYPGFGDTPEKAVRDAIDKWNSGNRYPTGGITFELPKFRDDLPVIKGNFETDGDSFWGSVSTFLGFAGLAAAAVAGIVTLIAPVPGSRIVSAAIWTSILSSSAAAVINVGTRVDEGFSSWKANAFDILTIVGNLFGVGGIVWSRGANVVVNTEKGLLKGCLIGQIGTDAVQGVILGIEFVEDFKKIESNPNLTPRERTKKLLELFRSAALSGALFYFSVKGTKMDLDNLNLRSTGTDKSTPKERLEKLAQRDVDVDMTTKPVVQGSAAAKTHKTKVQLDHELDPPTPAGHAKTPRIRSPEEAFKDAMGHKHHSELALEIPLIRALNPQLNNLTVNEMIAIRGYTSDKIKPEFGNQEDFTRINNALRFNDAPQLALLKPYIDLLTSGLNKLPPSSGTRYRIIQKISPDEVKAQFVVGKEWIDRGFMSTSEKMLDAAIVQIQLLDTKSGRRIKELSKFPNEGGGEFLFPPEAAVFDVVKVFENGGLFFIIMRER